MGGMGCGEPLGTNPAVGNPVMHRQGVVGLILSHGWRSNALDAGGNGGRSRALQGKFRDLSKHPLQNFEISRSIAA